MAFRDRIEVVVDFVTGPAQKGLGKLKADVAAADGVMGKAKVAAKGLGDTLSAYAGPAALAAGAAIFEFGRKSVMAFQDSALAAGQFADATGIAVEDASRWIAVGDDFEISAESISSAMMRMNRALASGAFDDYGIAVRYAADGTVDANATFQSAITTIGGIKDATERAKAAQAIFGRNYASIARLMEMSATDLADALGSVSDQQVIDEEELEKARDFQAAMDTLQDSLQDFMLLVGEQLVPALSDMANTVSTTTGLISDADEATGGWLSKIAKAVGQPIPFLDRALGGLADGFKWLKAGIQGTIRSTEEVAAEQEYAAAAAEYYTSRMGALADEQANAKDSADDLRVAVKKLYDEITGQFEAQLDYESATIGLAEAYDAYIEKLGEAKKDGKITREELLDLSGAMVDLKGDVIDTAESFAEQSGAAEGSTGFIQRQIDELRRQKDLYPELTGWIDTYIAALLRIPPQVTTSIMLNPGGGFDGITYDSGTGRRDTDADGVEDRKDSDPFNPALRAFGGGGFAGFGGGSGGGSSSKTAVMSKNSLWQKALSAWGAAGNGPSAADKAKAQKAKVEQRFYTRLDRGRRRYERGTWGHVEYFEFLDALNKEFGWKPHSKPGMAIWREMDTVLANAARDQEEAARAAEEAAGGSAGGSSGSRGSSAGAGSMPGAAVGAGRITNVTIPIHLSGLFVGTEAEMRRAVKPLIPAIAREIDKYEKGL